MGSNALPCLIEWIQYEPAPWQDRLALRLETMPALADNSFLIWMTFNRAKMERTSYAKAGFHILGPEAASAVPELTHLLNSTNRGQYAHQQAADALAEVGLAGMPSLLEALTNSSRRIRLAAVHALTIIKNLGTNAEPLIPPLVRLAQDTNASFATPAVHTLANLGMRSEVVVQALTNAFRSPEREVRYWAVSAFRLSSPAEAFRAEPALEGMLNDPDDLIREDATNILARLGRGAITNAPLSDGAE